MVEISEDKNKPRYQGWSPLIATDNIEPYDYAVLLENRFEQVEDSAMASHWVRYDGEIKLEVIESDSMYTGIVNNLKLPNSFKTSQSCIDDIERYLAMNSSMQTISEAGITSAVSALQ